jgi:hypothetical protein
MYATGPHAKLGFRVTSVLVNIIYIFTLANFSFVQKPVKLSKKNKETYSFYYIIYYYIHRSCSILVLSFILFSLFTFSHALISSL